MEKQLKRYRKSDLIYLIIDYEEQSNILKQKLIKKEKEMINLTQQLKEMNISSDEESEEETINIKHKNKKSILKTIEYHKNRIKTSNNKLFYQTELDRILKENK